MNLDFQQHIKSHALNEFYRRIWQDASDLSRKAIWEEIVNEINLTLVQIGNIYDLEYGLEGE